MRNIFAGRAGPRSIPSPLCPGTQLWQEPRGCPHFSLPTCALALSEPGLRKHRDAQFPLWGLWGSQNTQPSRTCPRLLPLDHLQVWLHLAQCERPPAPRGESEGDFNEAGVVLSPPSPAPTYLLSPLRGQAAASLVSDRTAAEMLLPTPVSLPGHSRLEANRSPYLTRGQDKLCPSPACCCLLVTCPSITEGCAVLEQRDGEAGTAEEDQLLSQAGSPPGRDCLEASLLPALAGWP